VLGHEHEPDGSHPEAADHGDDPDGDQA